MSSHQMLPPKGEPKLKGSSVYLPEELWAALDDVAADTKEEDPSGKGYSRNEVVSHFLRWALQEWKTERRGKKKKD